MNKEYPKKIADNVTMYAADPILYVVDNFLSNDECNAFIEASEGKLQPSTVINLDNELQHENRTSENCWIEHDANDIVHEVSKRLSILVQIPIRNAEQYQLVYYKKGAQYTCRILIHLTMRQRMERNNWEPGGQRMITVIAYLNDVEEGGETGFPELGINVPPKKGDAGGFSQHSAQRCSHPSKN
ncbi:MAG: 2OG-Fe(II) oxygenase [Gammaproteobacteria bacterium]